tara:strand:+ start:840 stop:1172 length:333 start_codon:yes stop_codon:yes gene_type:complete
MDLIIGLALCLILLPINITLTFMSFRYDPKAVFIFIGGAMFFNLVASGIYTFIAHRYADNLKDFAIGVCLSIVVCMLCKVVMAMRNLHVGDQIKELKKLKSELEGLSNRS